jgi:hypothetical protein
MEPRQLRLMVPPHRNQQLFSDHYLNVILPEQPGWKMQQSDAGQAMAAVRRIFENYVPSANEAQTERDFVRPVLEALGHTFEVQVSLRTPAGTKQPDYIFYRDLAGLNMNKGKIVSDTDLRGALAVGDAKYWERPLDQASQGVGDPFTNKNPGYQISFYIQHTGLPWGILTNGRRWRLYHKETAHKLDRFYEVDLVDLLEEGDPVRFQYFSGFFGRKALDDGPLSLDAMLRESMDYAHGVSESLKGQVYDALRHVMQGFLDYAGNGLRLDRATLQEIHTNGLILLYRLLFILYAEARGLLPLQSNQMYRDVYSLDAIKKEIARTEHQRFLPTSGLIWPKLRHLFQMINQGEPPLNVGTFNGGLFDPERHPFLDRYAVGDYHLRLAIDKLARVGGQFIDYRDLAERHLGTIYEGLLEFQVRSMEEPANGWSVELVTHDGGRKGSGSYYTPTLITRYMVEQAVGPVVDAALSSTAAQGSAAQVRAVLDLNVLDCAMGSGHFLVETTEYIARRLVESGLLPMDLRAPAGTGGADFDELAYWKRRVAQSCVYGVDLNPLAVDLAKLSLWLVTAAADRPLSFLDHHLRAGNSLVGAWLTDLVVPADEDDAKRRKRAEKRQQAAQAAGQLPMLDDEELRRSMSTAVDAMWLIEGSPAATITDVKDQEALYEGLRSNLTSRYGRLADLMTARRLGLATPPAFLPLVANYALGRSLTAPPQFDTWLADAEEIAGARRFFHWELEFPEIFFDRHGYGLDERAGFDVVLGNPPYLRHERFSSLKPYLKAVYPEVYDGMADLYVYFYARSLRLTRPGGRMAYIVTNKWLRAGYGEPLRGYFAERGVLEQILDFGHAPVFEAADVFPCITMLKRPFDVLKEEPPTDGEVLVTSFPRAQLRTVELSSYVREHSHIVRHDRLGRAPWSLDTASAHELLTKIRGGGVPLSEFAHARPNYGIKTGFNPAFLIDTPTRDRLIAMDTSCADVIRPYLRGQDMKRWAPEWGGMWVITLKSSSDHAWPWSTSPEIAEEVFHQTFPSLYQHMKPLEVDLRKRQDHGTYWWELRSCSYYPVFDQPKIMYQEIQFHPALCFDNQSFFSNNKTFILVSQDLYLLAVLNSPLMWWHNWRYFPHMKDEALNPVGDLVASLPIAPPTEETRAEVRPAVERLIAITRADQDARRALLDWLRTEFGVEKPGQQLQDIGALDADAFVNEVRRRRSRAASVLSPGTLQALRSGYADLAEPVRARRWEAATLEARLADLVNQAYGLTPEDVALLWETAPPRMPVGPPDGGSVFTIAAS